MVNKYHPVLKIVKERLENLSQKMEDIINTNLIEDGDTEETSQRICVLNALHNLDATITGIENKDLKPELRTNK